MASLEVPLAQISIIYAYRVSPDHCWTWTKTQQQKKLKALMHNQIRCKKFWNRDILQRCSTTCRMLALHTVQPRLTPSTPHGDKSTARIDFFSTEPGRILITEKYGPQTSQRKIIAITQIITK